MTDLTEKDFKSMQRALGARTVLLTKEGAWDVADDLLGNYDKKFLVEGTDLCRAGEDVLGKYWCKWHFGKVELKTLLDAIYGEDQKDA